MKAILKFRTSYAAAVRHSCGLVGALLALWTPRVAAEVALPALFSDHAVLQRGERVPVWGKAAAGEEVRVKLGEATAQARAGADGRWQVHLNLGQAPAGPHTLEVKGIRTIAVHDVMIGEVWLASGQSNMEWVVANTTGAKDVVARSANSALRQFRVAKNSSPTPTADLQGKWEVAGPTTTGGFSATGYFFAKAIQEPLAVPVGFINASWGGTPIEAWTSAAALARDPTLQASAEKYRADEQCFPDILRAFQTAWADWAARFQRSDEFHAEPREASAWTKTPLPPGKAINDLPAGGVAWLRQTFVIQPPEAGLQQAVTIGPIDGFYTAFFNGEKIAEVTPATGRPPSNTIYVKGDLIRAGQAVFSVRISNPAGSPTIRGDTPLRFNGRAIAGDWDLHLERKFPPLSDEARKTIPPIPAQPLSRQTIGAYLYNGMIAPLVPYGIRGAIWFQGETNTGRAWQYRTAFPLLIQDWRGAWGTGDFPFYFCQLANFGEKRSTPGDNNWAELRDAQSATLALPNTGQAVLIDVGEADDVHARGKQVVGTRLAALALAQTYGRAGESSGPIYRKMAIEGGEIRLHFLHLGGGLVAHPLPSTYQPRSTVDRRVPLLRNSPDSELEGFSICGADRKWVWARASIEGDTVLVSSPSVKNPVAVRYAWTANPTCNLYNRAGLPASPFRTDDFPLSTTSAKY